MTPPAPRRHASRTLVRFVFAVALVAGGFVGVGPGGHVSTAAALSRWTGGIDLYRPSAFTMQQTWLWCTAADVQVARNIVHREADHSRSRQQAYFSYMREHDRYAIPVSDGTEPSGWAAGMRRFVDGRYRLVASSSFDSAVRSAVTSLRRTNLPVGLLVAHGDHAWLLTGFAATADPAATSRFTVTSIRVTGPLWGLEDHSYGYDMRPDTRLTPIQLRTFFSPWHYGRLRMAWEGRWVSIQGIPAWSAPRTTPAAASSARSVAATLAPIARRAPSASVAIRPTRHVAVASSPVSAPAGRAARTPGAIAVVTAPVDPGRFGAAVGTATLGALASRAVGTVVPGWRDLGLAIAAVGGLIAAAIRTIQRGRRRP